jgi:hypothetical protein
MPARVQRLGQARQQAQRIYDWMNAEGRASVRTPDDRRRLAALGRCGSFLQFRHWLDHGEVRLHAADFCQQARLCQLCAVRRSGKLLGKFMPKFEQVMASAPTHKYAFLTLTIKNRADLYSAFEHLTKSWRIAKERGRDQRKKNRGCSEFRRITGYVASIEVTYKNGWHPHMHLIVQLDSFMDQAKLSREWLEITGDSKIVDIRQINRADPLGSAAELFKYQFKFSSMSPALVWQASSELAGRRLLASGGAFFGVSEPDTLTDDALTGPYRDYFYRWLDDVGYSL